MSFDAANSIPRRVPRPVMRPALEFCKPTGVHLNGGRRVIVFADRDGLGELLATRLSAAGTVPLVVGEALPDEAYEALLADWLAAGPISAVYWLPALDAERPIADLSLEAWREKTRVRAKLLYRTMRRLYPHMDHENAFLVAATRCGGQHGYGEDGSWSAVGGAITGFAKAFKRERPKATVKVVDVGSMNERDLVEILLAETVRDPSVVEVGYRDGARWTIALAEQSAADGRPGLALSKDSVFVVTGAAGSIVSAIVADLAAASGGVFYLLDRVPEPDRNSPDLARFATDKDALKQDIAARLKARGDRVTPVMVERELGALERSHAALQAMKAVEAAGGLAIYMSVDLTDPASVADAIDVVRQQSGRVDVLVHAAGLEISRFLPDKEPAEFDRVFDVKANGWFNLLKSIGDMPFESAVVFSSIAGRFGNAGQTDYSAANDLLCKSVLNFRKSRPETRGIAIDWTAWSGIGMASRGSIPKMMQMAGIDMLAPEAGIPIVRRELTEGGTWGEVVIASGLGVMAEELDAVGVHVEAAATRERLAVAGPMIGRIEKMTAPEGLVVETTLDPRVQPFLLDHQIDGTPVLPGVMGIEAFAELATLMLPGYGVVGVDDMHFQAAFKYFRQEPRTLRLQAVFTPQGDTIVARCRLIGTKHVPTHAEPQQTVHFTGRVRLSRTALERRRMAVPRLVAERIVRAPDIYRVYFHGPAYQVLDSAWRSGDMVIARLAAGLGPAHVPADRRLVMAPRLIEACLQAAGLWDLGLKETMALPHRIDSLASFTPREDVERPLFAVVRPDVARNAFDADVIDADGDVYVQVRGYRTVEVPAGFDDAAVQPLKIVMTADSDEHAIEQVATIRRK